MEISKYLATIFLQKMSNKVGNYSENVPSYEIQWPYLKLRVVFANFIKYLVWSDQRVFSKNAIKFQLYIPQLQIVTHFCAKNQSDHIKTNNKLHEKKNSGKFKIGCWISCSKYVNCCAMRTNLSKTLDQLILSNFYLIFSKCSQIY